MANLYEFIGAKPGASLDEIQKRLAETELRMKQTGDLYNEKYDRMLHQARHILLDAEARREYDTKLGFNRPASPSKKRPAPGVAALRAKEGKILKVGILVLLVACLAGFWGWKHWTATRPWPVGSYLRSTSTGQIAAVLVEKTSGYKFPSGSIGKAYRVKMIDTGELRWVGSEQLRAEFTLGSMAPPSERKIDK